MDNPIISKLAGDFESNPWDVKLTTPAKELIAAAFEGIPSGKLWDYHVHIAGTGAGGTGCWINPGVLSWLHPVDHIKANMFINAAGIEDMEKADEQYLNRLVTLIRNIPGYGKYCILALDRCYDKEGNLDESNSKLYIPNEYVFEISQLYPDIFVPCISIHPYRRDAVEELEKWGSQGVKMLKWMPGTMGMDASDPLCEPFYEKMKQYNMVLLTHTGKEETIVVTKFQPLNNPLLFRKPLDMGVKIIMAHCAGLGVNADLDVSRFSFVENNRLFLRLMDEKRYEGLLFGDIAALTEINRCGKALQVMLHRTDLHHRIINGSDYPLPAINSVVSTELLVRLGYIKESEQKPLQEIYKMNPLLFDFVLKRTLRDPQNKRISFSAAVFMYNDALGIASPGRETEALAAGNR